MYGIKEEEMKEQKLEALTHRLDRLERENRWWKVIGIAAIAFLGLLTLMGATGSKVGDDIWARNIFLIDEEGNLRITLSAKSGSSGILFSDEGGKLRAILGMKRDGSPFLTFGDKANKSRLKIALTNRGASSLIFSDKFESPRIILSLDSDDNSLLGFSDKEGKPRGGLFLSNANNFDVTLLRNNSTDGIKLTTNPDGVALAFYDKNGTIRAILFIKDKGASLTLIDNDGKVIWSAP